jgi:hypothetical protein
MRKEKVGMRFLILDIPFTLQILSVSSWAVLADLQGENSPSLIPDKVVNHG